VSRLPDIQDAFQRYLLAGDADIHSHVVGTQRVPIEARLAIYGDGYRSRLIEALEATFPVLAELLGETDFQELGTRYVAAHESTFFSIRYYGDRMAEFLSADPRYAKAPVLAEIARWEWAMAAVFDAADADPVDVGAFAALAPEDWAQLRFEWIPAIEILELEWNTSQIWKAVTEGSGDDAEPGNSAVLEPVLADAPVSYLIWRQSLQIYFRPLAPTEAAIIAAARAGQSFGELCLLLCEHLPDSEASLQAAGYLRGWVQSGLIAAVTQG